MLHHRDCWMTEMGFYLERVKWERERERERDTQEDREWWRRLLIWRVLSTNCFQCTLFLFKVSLYRSSSSCCRYWWWWFEWKVSREIDVVVAVAQLTESAQFAIFRVSLCVNTFNNYDDNPDSAKLAPLLQNLQLKPCYWILSQKDEQLNDVNWLPNIQREMAIQQRLMRKAGFNV